VGCRDNDARRFARVRKTLLQQALRIKRHYFLARDRLVFKQKYAPLNQLWGLGSAMSSASGALAEIEQFKYCHTDT